MGLMESKMEVQKNARKDSGCQKWLLRRITVVLKMPLIYRKCGFVQCRPSRTVLLRGCPECPKCVRKRINVVRNETPKSRSHVSKMGFVVVPSVSDGVLNLPSQREGAIPEHSAHGSPKWLLKLKDVVLIRSLNLGNAMRT